jgi:hypothetical protein
MATAMMKIVMLQGIQNIIPGLSLSAFIREDNANFCTLRKTLPQSTTGFLVLNIDRLQL